MPVTLDLLSPSAGVAGASLSAVAPAADAGADFGRALAGARRPECPEPPPAKSKPAQSAAEAQPAARTRADDAPDAAAQADAAADGAGPREPVAAGDDTVAAGEADAAQSSGEDAPTDDVDPRARAAAEVLAELGLIPPPPAPPVSAAACSASPEANPAASARCPLPTLVAANFVQPAPAAVGQTPPTPVSPADIDAQAQAAPGAVAATGDTLPLPVAETDAGSPPAAAPPLPAMLASAAAILRSAQPARPAAPPPPDVAAAADTGAEALPLPVVTASAAAVAPAPAPATDAVPAPGLVAQALAADPSQPVGDGKPALPEAATTPATSEADAAPAPAATPSPAPQAPVTVAADAGLNPAGVRGATASDAQAVAAPQAPLPVANPRAWAPLLGQHLMHLVQTGDTQATVRVNPPQLGPVELRLDLKDSLTHVSFYAHDAQVREALEQSLPRLRELLGAQGLQLGQSHVGDQASQQQQQPNPDGGSMAGFGDRRGNGRNDGTAGRGEAAVASDAELVLPVRNLLGGVDHYV